MRKIQLSVMLIALCLLFATYASALKPRPIGRWPRRAVSLSDAEAERPNWRKIGEKLAHLGQAAAHLGAIQNLFLSEAEAEKIRRNLIYTLSDAEAEKINWKKVGKKTAGIGQAAANLGAIKDLFLDDDDVAESVDWRQAPWIVRPPGRLTRFPMSDAEAEKPSWMRVPVKKPIASIPWRVGSHLNGKSFSEMLNDELEEYDE